MSAEFGGYDIGKGVWSRLKVFNSDLFENIVKVEFHDCLKDIWMVQL
jgi:hypothetical protein